MRHLTMQPVNTLHGDGVLVVACHLLEHADCAGARKQAMPALQLRGQ